MADALVMAAREATEAAVRLQLPCTMHPACMPRLGLTMAAGGTVPAVDPLTSTSALAYSLQVATEAMLLAMALPLVATAVAAAAAVTAPAVTAPAATEVRGPCSMHWLLCCDCCAKKPSALGRPAAPQILLQHPLTCLPGCSLVSTCRQRRQWRRRALRLRLPSLVRLPQVLRVLPL